MINLQSRIALRNDRDDQESREQIRRKKALAAQELAEELLCADRASEASCEQPTGFSGADASTRFDVDSEAHNQQARWGTERRENFVNERDLALREAERHLAALDALHSSLREHELTVIANRIFDKWMADRAGGCSLIPQDDASAPMYASPETTVKGECKEDLEAITLLLEAFRRSELIRDDAELHPFVVGLLALFKGLEICVQHGVEQSEVKHMWMQAIHSMVASSASDFYA